MHFSLCGALTDQLVPSGNTFCSGIVATLSATAKTEILAAGKLIYLGNLTVDSRAECVGHDGASCTSPLCLHVRHNPTEVTVPSPRFDTLAWPCSP
jgi:hypothetical protein